MRDFLPIYQRVEPKLMHACSSGNDGPEARRSPEAAKASASQGTHAGYTKPPLYVPFDLRVFDADDVSTEADSQCSWEETASDEGGWAKVARAVDHVEDDTDTVKAMTKAQRMKLKRQQRRRRINTAKFKQNINDREEIIGPDGISQDSVVVCELADLHGSLEKLDKVIDALGYLPERGNITQEEQLLLEEHGIGTVKVTKTVLPRELEKYGLAHLEAPAREKEGKTMRDFGVFGLPVEDCPEVRGLPGFNYSRTIEACGIKEFETDDPEVRFRLVYHGSDSRTADNEAAIFQTIRDVPASLLEIRIVLVICRLLKFIVRQGDVVGAYLNADAPANSFVRLGKAWLSALSAEAQRRYQELLDAGKPILVPLLKSLYGHVLSGALWARWFASRLSEMGWCQVRDVSDALWFLYDDARNLIGILAVYVDDLIVGASQETIAWFEAELLKVVRLKNGLHEVGRLLGGLYRSRMWTENAGETTEEHEEIFVSVGQYAAHIAKRYFSSRTAGSKFAKPGRFATPADPESCAAVPGTAAVGEHGEEAPIHIGGSMWLQRVGLPSLCTSTNALAREIHHWTVRTDAALHRHMSWIATHAVQLGLLMYAVSGCDDLTLLIQTDADHGSNPRSRLSISGFHIFLVSSRGTFALLEWVSARQRAVALSTAEAELTALQAGLKRAVEILMVLRLAGLRPRVVLCCDSTSALAVAQTGISTKLRYASVTQGTSAEWVRYVCELLGCSPHKVDTVVNSSDIQTKPLARGPFMLHSRFIGVVEEEVWQQTRRCEGYHHSPLGRVRCKARAVGSLCQWCAAAESEVSHVCPCWYGVGAWDERYKEKYANVIRV